MRGKLAAIAVLAGTAFAVQNAPAQSVNSGWNLGGGTGIGRHATGFSGTSGDPLYQENRAPGQIIPGYPVTNHPSVSDAGTLRGPIPTAPGYAPPPSAPFEYYTPSPGRR
jgi:hypothetical protein